LGKTYHNERNFGGNLIWRLAKWTNFVGN